MPSFRGHRGLMGGILILAIGVILLLDQEGMVSASHVFSVFWPAWLILFGMEDLVAGFTPNKRKWGGFVVLAGVLLLLNNLNFVHIRFAILWPLVLIGLGSWLLLSAYGYAPRVWPPHGWHQPWIRRGPGGPMGSEPYGPGFPMGGPGSPLGGPGSPLGGPGSPLGGPGAPTVPGPASDPAASASAPSAGPSAPSNPWGASAQQPGQGQPGVASPQAPFAQAPFSQTTDAPPNFSNWHDWHRWQKNQARELRRQMKAWKRGWDPRVNWQQQNWAGQQTNYPPNSAPNYAANSAPGGPDGNNDSQFNYSVIFSHVERHITSKNFKTGTLSAIFGGFEIDLSRADIEGDEAVIYADAFFGGGEIRIPETWHVVIEGNALFGAFMDETRQLPPATTPAKKLIIRGTAVFGGVTIEN